MTAKTPEPSRTAVYLAFDPDDITVKPEVREQRYPSGRVIETGNLPQEYLRVSGPDGRVELHIEFTAKGPVLRFESAALDLQARRVNVSCDEFQVDARSHIALRSEGNMTTQVGGDQRTEIAGSMETSAEDVKLVATRGDAVLEANDIARINGEKILLNTELDPDEEKRKIAEFLRALKERPNS